VIRDGGTVTSAKRIVAALFTLAVASTAASGANWLRESSDSWIWVDVDSISSGGNLTYYTWAIGCNGQGGMPVRGEDGYVSPVQCTFGKPTTDAFNCTNGDVYHHDMQSGALVLATFNPRAMNTVFRMVCGHDMPPEPAPPQSPPTAPTPTQAEMDWNAMTGAAAHNDLGTVKRLIASGVSPDAPHPDLEDRISPLGAAVCNRHPLIALYLLSHGADIEASENVGGFTALMFAANCGDTDMEKLLLAHGAKVNAKAKDGSTPLDFALATKDAKHRKAAQVLFAHGAASGKGR